jgi:GT2 family glycosyltransferase
MAEATCQTVGVSWCQVCTMYSAEELYRPDALRAHCERIGVHFLMKKAARTTKKPAKARAQKPKRKSSQRKPIMRHSREG